MLQRYKHQIIISCFFVVFFIAFLKLYTIILPFILGLLMAIAVEPVLVKIQRIVKNRNLATSLFLLGIVGIIASSLFFFTYNINRDFKRLNHSFTVITTNNQVYIDQTTKNVKDFINNIYDFKNIDSLKNSFTSNSQIDTESITSSFDKIKALFPSDKNVTEKKNSSFNFIFILFTSIFYFILILYQYDYFQSIKRRYFTSKINSTLLTLYDDFHQSFIHFFKLRTKVIALMIIPYAVTFAIMDMPGMILLTFLITILAYIPFLEYLALIPLSISCLVLSIENNQSFLFLFGIVLILFVVMSLIDQLILTPIIMEKRIGINPVILVLTISIWGYLFGFFGILVGIPLTSLLIIYLKRYVLESYRVVLQVDESDEEEE